MSRGWTSTELPVIEDGDTLWTVADAARFLGPLPDDPPDTPARTTMGKLRSHARLYPRRFPVVGKRRTSPEGHPGRYARLYDAQVFIDLYERMGQDERSRTAG